MSAPPKHSASSSSLSGAVAPAASPSPPPVQSISFRVNSLLLALPGCPSRAQFTTLISSASVDYAEDGLEEGEYVLSGRPGELVHSELSTFDAAGYLKLYPDVAAAGIS